VVLAGFRRPYGECETWRAEALRRIAEWKPVAVVLAGAGSRYTIDAEAWEEGARRTIAELAPAHSTLVILRDTPSPGFDVPTCLARAEYRGGDPGKACAFSRQQGMDPGIPFFKAEQRAANGAADVFLVDLTDQLCSTDLCAVVTGETVRFSDHSHLTASFSRSLAPALAEALRQYAR
jgi:hypothetical protein